jgi:hypothetical protein
MKRARRKDGTPVKRKRMSERQLAANRANSRLAANQALARKIDREFCEAEAREIFAECARDKRARWSDRIKATGEWMDRYGQPKRSEQTMRLDEAARPVFSVELKNFPKPGAAGQ